MNFKSAIIYRVVGPINTSDIETKLAEHAFQPCGSTELSRTGWVPVVGDGHDAFSHAVTSDAGTGYAVRLLTEEKILPGPVINRAVNDKVREIEQQQGRKVYRRERTQLKDEIILDMLPRAFTRQTQTRAIVLPNLIVVEAASHNKAENLLSMLRNTLGTLPVVLPDVKQSPGAVMNHWVEQQQPLPKGFQLLDECDLIDNLVEGGTVKVRGQDLTSSEVTAHLEAGKRVAKLAVEWDNHLRFHLHEDLRLTRIRMTDEAIDGRGEPADDELDRFDADLYVTAVTINQLHNELMAAFGGELTAQGAAA